MLRLVVFLIAFFSATVAHANSLEGLWLCNDRSYYYFGENGELSLPNSKIKTGVSWEQKNDNTLELSYFYVPATKLTTFSFTIEKNDGTTLVLRGEDNAKHVLTRSNETVKTYTGEVFYRERMMLPPSVELRIALYKNADSTPFMLYSVTKEGKIPMPFSVQYVAKDTDKVYMQAKIYHEFEQLFASERAVSVGTEKVLLYRGAENVNKLGLDIPSKYVATDGTILFLEKNGVAILQKGKELSLAHWAQVDRNHTLEIVQANQPVAISTITNKESILFKTINGQENVTFKVVPNEQFNIGAFLLVGTVYVKNGQPYFIDCVTNARFKINLHQVLQKHIKQEYFIRPVHIQIKAVLSRDKAGYITLSLLDVEKVMNSVACSPVYQNAVLSETYWRLKTLNGKPAQAFDNQREPHIILRDKMASGSDGCNNFFMQYTVEKEKINFKQGGSTLMLCPQGQEQAMEYLQTLAKVNGWDIKGSVLNLKVDNNVVASFEAVYL